MYLPIYYQLNDFINVILFYDQTDLTFGTRLVYFLFI